MDQTLLIRAIEAILYVSTEPVPLKKLEAVFEPDGVDRADIKESLDALRRDYLGRGVELVEVGGGYQMRTSSELAPILSRMEMPRPVKLSQASLETLAIVAYRQPMTRAEVEEVRGVDSGGVFRTLFDRGLVKVVGKKDVPGRPLLWATTRKFLEVFGLSSLTDLPTLREVEELTGGADGIGMGALAEDHAPELPLEHDPEAANGAEKTPEEIELDAALYAEAAAALADEPPDLDEDEWEGLPETEPEEEREPDA